MFLAVYTWDARTGSLSRLANMTGLEIARAALSPGIWLKDRVGSFISDYVALSDVAEENARLREDVGRLELAQLRMQEERQELLRLRKLYAIPEMPLWEQAGARVIAARFGPQAVLNSVVLNKGFTGGALPGAPVVMHRGLAGKILHTAPHSSSVLLLNDPSFRIAVIGQESRVRGVLAGAGARKPLDVRFVAPNNVMKEGEVLVSSGIDGVIPAGVPVARVTAVQYAKDMLFPQISAEPLVDLDNLEEVVVLIPPRGTDAGDLTYSPFLDEQYNRELPDAGVSDEETARGMAGGQ